LTLREAVEAWVDALEAVERDAFQTATGESLDRDRTAKLIAKVELARQRCEQIALRDHNR